MTMLVNDILASLAMDVELPQTTTISGRVARVKIGTTRIFLQVTDPTGTLQAVINQEEQPSLFEIARKISTAERIVCKGVVDANTFKIRARVGEPPIAIPTLVVSELTSQSFESSFASSEPNVDRFTVQAIYLARCRTLAAAAYEKHGYTEVEPRLITLAAPISGLEPLQVNFLGFGSPAHLFPSPARQLQDIILKTNLTSVFAVSKIFSTTYRDEITSNEALTAMGMRIVKTGGVPREPSEMIALLNHITSVHWFQGADGKKEHFRLKSQLITTQKQAHPKPLSEDDFTDEMKIEEYDSVYSTPPDDGAKFVFFQRVIAPQRSIVAERIVKKWLGDTSIEVTTIHLERMIGLIPNLVLRGLSTVGNPPTGAQA